MTSRLVRRFTTTWLLCLLIAPIHQAIAGEEWVIGEWTLVKGGSGKISITGGPGQYIGVVTEPVTWTCTHPVGEIVWQLNYKGPSEELPNNEAFDGWELWYTENCTAAVGWGPAWFLVAQQRYSGGYYMAMCTIGPDGSKKGCSGLTKGVSDRAQSSRYWRHYPGTTRSHQR